MKNFIARMFVVSALLSMAGLALAQIVPSLPVTLQNGTLADANQVMANFNALLTGINANAAKNGINSDITALTALSTPITPAQGGSTNYYGGTSGGTANVQTLGNPSPAGFTLTAGRRLSYIANLGNTAAMTLNVNGLGAKSVFRTVRNSVTAVAGGEIYAGMVVSLVYDGTQFQLLNSAAPQPPGMSMVFRGVTPPLGFVYEDGNCYLRTTYPALYAEIGLTYGTCGGDPTLFPVPDSRGRMDAGRDDQGTAGAANRITNAGSGCVGTTLGLGCGAQNHTITTAELAAHTHTSPAVTDPTHQHFVANGDTVGATVVSATNIMAGAGNPGSSFDYVLRGSATLATLGLSSASATSITLAATTGSTGSGTAAPILNPLLIANKIIRY